jgi:hypothetical protein
MPPHGAKFAPWTTVRDKVGTLYLAAGTWRDAAGHEVETPQPIETGRPSAGAVVNPEGETEPATNLPRDAGMPEGGGPWEPPPVRDTGERQEGGAGG